MNNSKLRFPALVILMLILCMPLHSQVIRINELVSSNGNCFYDEDGDTPDWIELYNAGTTPVNLSGYGISDDIKLPYKWVFPDYILGTGEFLLLAASDKDRRIPPLFWETVISRNDTFRYLVPAADPGAWRMPEYLDATWSLGRSGFGYGDDDDTTLVPEGTIAVMMRRPFQVTNLESIQKLMLHVDFDDAFIAYINGHEIARSQIGTVGVPPAWDSRASSSNHEATMYQGGLPDAFSCDSAIKYLVEGNNLFAIEVHNIDTASSDLSCIPFLSLGSTAMTETSKGMAAFLTFSDSYFHLNFKISASGDTVMLTDPEGVMIDSLYTGEIPYDISIGLQPDGISSRWFFPQPTPGTTNNTEAFPILSFTDPVFSIPGGYYTNPFELSISGTEAGDSIWYTIDGSVPGKGDSLYADPIYIDESTVIRAIILGANRMNRKPVTQSYLFRAEDPTLTTISLSTDPPNFFDWDTGIYVMGPNASPEPPNDGANFWYEWERPIHIELYEKDGSLGFDADAGVKIFGGYSRSIPQRSMAFFARGKYGMSSFRYPFFSDLRFTEYNNFILRNAGNDWNNAMFRDAMMTSLLEQMDIDRQAYRPASIYLNGEYWGLLNIREKVNEHFLAAHHNVDPYQIDLLEREGSPINGDAEHYNQMLNFLYANSPAAKANYDQLKTMMNVENFMEYQLAQIYFNNTDWPGNNIKFWRPRTPEGRWRWIIFDTDFGFGIWDDVKTRCNYNTLAFALATNGPDWPNPPWSTYLLRRLMESTEFRNEFINRFADRMNTVFNYQHVLQRINLMSNAIQTEIPYHLARWNSWGENIDYWNSNVEKMRVFASERLSYIRLYISEQFGNIGYSTLTVNTSSSQSGTVNLNTLQLEGFPWSGIYFRTIPVSLTAIPKVGYLFVRWDGPVANPLSSSTTITLSGAATIKAVFESDGSSMDDIVINEIYYNDPSGFDADDWIEILNKGNVAMNLSGWILKDEEDSHRFVIPEGTSIAPNEYLVFSSDTAKFSVAYPEAVDPIGEFSFGLGSTGDCVRLFTFDSILVDTVRFGVEPPWPPAPNEYGTSIELINPDYDNAQAINWTESIYPHGTPGERNSLYTGIHQEGSFASITGNRILKSYPNPFSWFTTIQFEMMDRAWVKIDIADLNGTIVNTLTEGITDAGVKEISWDGFNSNGQRMAPGVYICILQTSKSTDFLRIVMLQ